MGILALPPDAPAQQETRESIIAAEQAAKAEHPPTVEMTAAERATATIHRLLTEKPSGFYPYFDSVWGGGGLTLGVGYRRRYADRAAWTVAGLYSLRHYKLIDAGTTSPGHADGRLSLSAHAGWRDAPRVGYFGLGMDSQPDDRANFRLKEVYAVGTADLRPNRWTTVIGSAGVEAYTLESGQGAVPSIEERFTGGTAPGLGQDPTYVHAEATAGIDWRQSPGYSRTGGFYGFTLHEYADAGGPLDFRRLDLNLVQHIPILRETWVLSVRGRLQTTIAGSGEVPYFLLPSLGSGSTLRAYESWRFRDRHSLLTSAEWRWFPNRLGMDMALFYDAGKVAGRRGDLNFRGMAHDFGIGVRFHALDVTPLRVDLAHGSEGLNIVFAGGTSF